MSNVAVRKTFRVAEVFGPTIQGEGPCAGVPVYFIRFGGCDYRCAWCDSMHAVDPEKVKELPMLAVSEILDKLRALPTGAYDVVLSGGNPLLWDLTHLCLELQDMGLWVHVETQGTLFRPWLGLCDEIIVSPKPPSSGMNQSVETTKEFLKNLRTIAPTRTGSMNVNVKYVAFDEVDLQYIRESSEALGLEDVYVSVGTRATDSTEDVLERYRNLITSLLENPLPISKLKILPQMHVLLWGHKLGV